MKATEPPSERESADPESDEEVSAAVATTIERELPDVAPQVRERVTRAAIRVVQQVAFSGPLPPPAFFRGYETVLPGAADRILKMAEQNQQSRHAWYSASMWNMRLGLIFGFAIALGLVGGAIYCASIGERAVALAFLTAGALSMVPALIKGWATIHPPDKADDG